MKHIFIKAAGILNLFSAILHLVGGQIELVDPLLQSTVAVQPKGELVGAWHMITILLFFTSYVILMTGSQHYDASKKELLHFIAMLYILSGIPFIVVSFWYGILAPQWLLLIPIGVLLILGIRKLHQQQHTAVV